MKKQPTRILQVLDQLSLGSGVSNIVMGYLRHLDLERFTFDVAIHKPSDPTLISEVRSKGGCVYQLPDIDFPFATPYRVAFQHVLEQYHYQIIHGHIPNASFLFLRQSKKFGIPHRIIHAHNSRGADKLWKRIRNKLLEAGIPLWANHYFACSDAAAEYLYGQSKSQAIILPNAIDQEQFRYSPSLRSEVRNELGLTDETWCIGHVGRFAPQKNHHFLLKAFAALYREHPQSRLILVGEGLLKEKIQHQIKNLGIEQAVLLTGERRDVHRLYQAFDLFWLPSHFEGWGIVALEAQASGLPCILSNAVPSEVGIVEGGFSFLPVNDIECWVNKSISFLSDYIRKDNSGTLKLKRLDWKTQIQTLERLYKQYINAL